MALVEHPTRCMITTRANAVTMDGTTRRPKLFVAAVFMVFLTLAEKFARA